jgi:hypothetical protein
MAHREVTGRKPACTAEQADRPPGSPLAIKPDVEESADEPATKAELPADEPAIKAEPAVIEPTAKGEPRAVTKAKATPIRGPPVPPAWYTLREFAAAHRLSEAMLFKLKAEGRGPRETAVGSRRYITFEDAAHWRAAQKEATAA